MYFVVILCFILVSWYFYVEDRYLLKLHELEVSDDSVEVKSGDILRVGVQPDGSVASHWLGRPLHHYVLVQSINKELYVIHTWYKKLTKYGNIHIPPSYQLQPLSSFIEHSNMNLVEVFRHPSIVYKDLDIEEVKDLIKSFGSSVRCYITIMNLIDLLYPELKINFGISGLRLLRNSCLWSFFVYKPLYFEQSLLEAGYMKSKILRIERVKS